MDSPEQQQLYPVRVAGKPKHVSWMVCAGNSETAGFEA
jgi:hypothetical protein